MTRHSISYAQLPQAQSRPVGSKPLRPCSLCERKHYAHGLCFPHYLMRRRRGTTDRILRPKVIKGGHGAYRVAWKNGKTVLFHRVLWEQAHGPIPPGYHIHHKNGDPRDNRLSNLECLSAHDHIAGHWACRRVTHAL